MKPNLFKFATSELSQDAFILWLLEWADSECATEDKALHETAQEFIRLLLNNKDLTIKSVNTKRQKNHIDVFAIVNEKYAIIIEDKTDTSEHNNQLERYEKWVTEQKEYSALETHIVYYKRGNESYFRLNKMTDKYALKRFTILTRKDVLEVLTKCTTNNLIFCDYVEYIQDIQRQTEAYQSLPVSDWSNYTWQGFYMALEKELQTGDWGYVPNKQGGFWGFYWHWKKASSNPDVDIYLQLEEKKLCVKAYQKDGVEKGYI